jgi:hypothetical protein
MALWEEILEAEGQGELTAGSEMPKEGGTIIVGQAGLDHAHSPLGGRPGRLLYPNYPFMFQTDLHSF